MRVGDKVNFEKTIGKAADHPGVIVKGTGTITNRLDDICLCRVETSSIKGLENKIIKLNRLEFSVKETKGGHNGLGSDLDLSHTGDKQFNSWARCSDVQGSSFSKIAAGCDLDNH